MKKCYKSLRARGKFSLRLCPRAQTLHLVQQLEDSRIGMRRTRGLFPAINRGIADDAVVFELKKCLKYKITL